MKFINGLTKTNRSLQAGEPELGVTGLLKVDHQIDHQIDH